MMLAAFIDGYGRNLYPGPKNPLFTSSRTSCSRQKMRCPELMDKGKQRNFCCICEF